MGGRPNASTGLNTIDKFPFAADGNATDVGDLTEAKFGGAAASSIASGYLAGGTTGSRTNVIEKFSFTVDGNATDVGDTVPQNYSAGQQI
jgi:hypothetical protein